MLARGSCGLISVYHSTRVELWVCSGSGGEELWGLVVTLVAVRTAVGRCLSSDVDGRLWRVGGSCSRKKRLLQEAGRRWLLLLGRRAAIVAEEKRLPRRVGAVAAVWAVGGECCNGRAAAEGPAARSYCGLVVKRKVAVARVELLSRKRATRGPWEGAAAVWGRAAVRDLVWLSEGRRERRAVGEEATVKRLLGRSPRRGCWEVVTMEDEVDGLRSGQRRFGREEGVKGVRRSGSGREAAGRRCRRGWGRLWRMRGLLEEGDRLSHKDEEEDRSKEKHRGRKKATV